MTSLKLSKIVNIISLSGSVSGLAFLPKAIFCFSWPKNLVGNWRLLSASLSAIDWAGACARKRVRHTSGTMLLLHTHYNACKPILKYTNAYSNIFILQSPNFKETTSWKEFVVKSSAFFGVRVEGLTIFAGCFFWLFAFLKYLQFYTLCRQKKIP